MKCERFWLPWWAGGSGGGYFKRGRHVCGVRLRYRVSEEHGRSGSGVLGVGIHAIENEGMDVKVEIYRPAETLQRAHGSTLSVGYAEFFLMRGPPD